MLEAADVVCKFTPLGFETATSWQKYCSRESVNLPRWGLKQFPLRFETLQNLSVNLPRWGLKLT